MAATFLPFPPALWQALKMGAEALLVPHSPWNLVLKNEQEAPGLRGTSSVTLLDYPALVLRGPRVLRLNHFPFSLKPSRFRRNEPHPAWGSCGEQAEKQKPQNQTNNPKASPGDCDSIDLPLPTGASWFRERHLVVLSSEEGSLSGN